MFANVLSEIQACRKFLLARRRGLTIWVIVREVDTLKYTNSISRNISIQETT